MEINPLPSIRWNFNLKWDFQKIINIPCHHVLANQNDLKLKKGAPLKQFLNINLGIGIIKKKPTFLFVFSTYLPVFLLKFRSGELVGCVHPMSTHSAYFWWTPLPQKQKIPEKWNDDAIIPFFQVFLIFGVAGFIKSMLSGYSLDAEFNSASNELFWSKFE